ncbi:MAG: ABC transporter permease [Acidimicrobiales bacterium]
MFKVTWRGLMAHKVRLGATVLAVLLGVAFMAGTQVFTDTFSKSFDEIFVDVNRGTDAVVRSSQKIQTDFGGEVRSRISETVVPQVRDVTGVKAADGAIRGQIRILDPDGKAIGDPNTGPPTFGLNWIADEQLNQWRIAEGRPPTGPTEVVLDKKTAADAGYQLGDQVGLVAGQGEASELTLVGIATFGRLDNFSGSSAALLETTTAQNLAAEPGKFDWIAVAGDGGVSQRELVDRIEASGLPTDTEAITGAEFTKESQDQFRKAIGTFKTILVVFALVSLFVGSFIIYNTFSIIVAQRTKEVALLRAIGASRRQVLGSVLVEATIVGLIASAVGIAAGIGLAILLKSALAASGLALPSTAPVITARTIISSLLIGLVVTVVAAVFPARRAATVPPVAALRDVAIDTSGASRVRLLAGLLLVALSALAIGVGLFTEVDNGLAIFGLGALVGFVGVAVLAPTFANPMSRVIGAPIVWIGGVTGHLARENARRNPKRTATTASALMIGVGLVTSIAIAGQSAKASSTDAIDNAIHTDFVIDSGGFGSGGLNPALAQDAQAVDGVGTAAGLRLNLAQIGDSAQLLLGFDPAALPKIFEFDVIDGSIADLGTQGVMISKRTAEDKGLTVGSMLTATFQQSGVQDLHVAAVFDTQLGTLPPGAYLVSNELWDANFPVIQQTDYQVYVRLAPGADPAAVRTQIDALAAAYPTAKVQDLGEFKRTQESQINQFLNVIYALLGLSLVIALIGIINTLLLSVYERVREIGLLRAVGETRRQLRSTVRWEAVIITVLGTLLGLVIGFGFGWALVRAFADQGIKVFAVPYAQLVLFVVFGSAAGILAAVYPAFRASRLNILAAISTD